MKITYYGHSCFMVEIGGKNLLFDPFIKPNERAAGIDVSKIKPDYILLSHGHFDHVADLEEIAGQSDATIVSIFEISSWLESQNYKNELVGMNVGGTVGFDFGSVKMVGAVHSSVLPDGQPGGVAAGRR